MKKSPKASHLILLSTIAFVAACASTPKDGAPKKLTKEERISMYISAANGALEENDPIGALQILNEADNLDPNLPEVHHVRALAFFAKKETAEALASAKRAVALAPEYSEANTTLGKILVDLGQLEEAEGPLKKAAADQLFRGAFKANTNLGILYYRQGKFDASARHLKKAIDQSPMGSCVAHYYLGHVELRDGHFRDAITHYDKATQKLCTNFPDAHMALGIAFERSHQFDRARKKFLDIRQNFPNSKFAEQAIDRLRYLP